jgi:type I restriction enzyme R subunit
VLSERCAASVGEHCAASEASPCSGAGQPPHGDPGVPAGTSGSSDRCPRQSNTIAWLAHRLASLHAADDTKIFDKVVVVTDRRVLDAQLQETVHQFEHAVGIIARIDESSAQLAEALTSTQAKIIITTLQKFGFIAAQVASLPDRRYAVLVDEAHSSQTGEAAKEIKAALGAGGAAIEEDNLSLFAFTATPKPKTLEIFGRRGVGPDGDTAYGPHHLYAMRQAIEEGFILDVLAAYTPYQTYFRLTTDKVEDPEVESRKAAAAIASYVKLHPQVMSQKARIVVDHVRAHTMREIGSLGKAMVVCSSRLHAVRMKIAIESYLAEQGWVISVCWSRSPGPCATRTRPRS